MARVSPSWTNSATASRIEATLSSATHHLRGRVLGVGGGEGGGDLLDGPGEQAQGGAALVGGDDQGRRQANGRLPRLQHEQAAAEAGQLDLLGQLPGGELDSEHQADPTDVLD